MSVDNYVFLRRDRMPTPSEWAAAIKQHGFELELDTDFDVSDFEGFLPCKYKGVEAGFEYLSEEANLDELAEEGLFEEPEKAQLGDSNFLVTCRTYSNFREYMTSMIASAVLAHLSGGYLAEGGGPPFISSDKAVEWAKSCLSGIEAEIARQET